ncbi:MAG: hypothetical protein OMM_02924 [Candidatus Magnetoglobus multicellularis str. Araruama]|uniref:Uncharacterized protein n=1 Tax=Candidatus Magnetoglobus multicellularis str. Araruama TaxID=890399 RepID=A0A1V1P7P0_9BACT|nr:MAG: hypothetical protein OMM_02924 [Candidatus Magnetoglobus multicellularis str. Araruama]
MIENLMQSIRKWTGLSSEDIIDNEQPDTVFYTLADTIAFKKFVQTAMPKVFNLVPQTLNAFGQSLCKESPISQISTLENMISKLDFTIWAETIKTWVLILQNIQTENKQFLTDSLKPKFDALVENIDFADLKEALSQVSSDIDALSENINLLMWQYPAKLVLLFSIIPLAGNTACMIARNTFKHFNDVPPDILADILISLIKEIDMDLVSQLMDESAELARKLHTGAALIGEPGADALTQQVKSIVAKLSENINSTNVFKARQAIDHIKNGIWEAWFARLSGNYDILSQSISLWFDKTNQTIRQTSQLTAMLDDLPDNHFKQTIGSQCQELEMTEIAEILNQLVQLALRLEQLSPEALNAVLFQWIDALDTDAIGEISDKLASPLMQALAPIIQGIAPSLIHAFCDAMAGDEQFAIALRQLKKEFPL